MPRILQRITDSFYADTGNGADARVLENLPQIVFQLDTKYRWQRLNKSWERITGFSRGHSIGNHYYDYIHPEDRDNLHEHIKDLHQHHGESNTLEARLVTREGTPCWLEIHAVHIANTEGHPVCIGTMTDITERIAEEAMLHASNRSLSGILNDLSGMVYRCRNDESWTMEYLSGGCLALTGYPPSAMVNNAETSWDSLIHPDDHDMVWAEVQNGVRDGRQYEMVFRIFDREKKLKWVWERGKGIFSEDGELLGLEGFITDITVSKQQSDQIQRAQLYDSQTGLLNLPLFKDRLAQAIDRCYHGEGVYTLLVIQFHRLFEAFERHGKHFEKDATSALIERLWTVLNERDSVCQLQSDRYAILIERAHDEQTIKDLTTQILASTRAPIQHPDATHVLTCSIGGTREQPELHSVEQVLHAALVATDQASAEGGNRYVVYEADTVDY